MPEGVFGRSDAEIDQLVRGKRSGIAVVGFGYIGTVIGAVLADRGWPVTGIDVRQHVVDEINRGMPPVCVSPDLTSSCPTTCESAGFAPRPTSTPSPTTILSSSRSARRSARTTSRSSTTSRQRPVPSESDLHPGHLVIAEEHRAAGHHARTLVQPILEEISGLRAGVDFGLAFCPERLAEGRAIRDLTSIPVVVGAVDERSARACSTLWRHTLGVESVVVDDPRTAEMVKLADNLWIDLNIALANELAKVCDGLGMDVLQVIDAANTMPKVNHNVNILMPSMGVGGYCLTKDPWFVNHLGRVPRVGSGNAADVEDRQRHDARLHLRARSSSYSPIRARQSRPAGLRCWGSPSRTTPATAASRRPSTSVGLLEESGCDLSVHDPWVTDEEARTVTKIPLTPDIESAVKNADALVFLTGHRQFHQIPLVRLAELAASDCVFLDGRNSFDPAEVRAAGLVYKGIGR